MKTIKATELNSRLEVGQSETESESTADMSNLVSPADVMSTASPMCSAQRRESKFGVVKILDQIRGTYTE